jgi:hypothetical protein
MSGQWLTVVIDDFLPCWEGPGPRTATAQQSDDPNPNPNPNRNPSTRLALSCTQDGGAWLPLWEKALAKACGSYHALFSLGATRPAQP